MEATHRVADVKRGGEQAGVGITSRGVPGTRLGATLAGVGVSTTIAGRGRRKESLQGDTGCEGQRDGRWLSSGKSLPLDNAKVVGRDGWRVFGLTRRAKSGTSPLSEAFPITGFVPMSGRRCDIFLS